MFLKLDDIQQPLKIKIFQGTNAKEQFLIPKRISHSYGELEASYLIRIVKLVSTIFSPERIYTAWTKFEEWRLEQTTDINQTIDCHNQI